MPGAADIHLHDNHGESDEHLPIGNGSIDFEPIFRTIEERGITAVLEQRSERRFWIGLEMLARRLLIVRINARHSRTF